MQMIEVSFRLLYPYNLCRLWTLSERQRMFAQENVYFTDCLLRHMHQYRFIFHLDPDEMPFLANYTSFPKFLDRVLSK